MLRGIASTIAVAVALFSQQAFSGPVVDDSSLKQAEMGGLFSTPLSFVENRGQFEPEVLFRAQAGGATFYLCRDQVVYLFLENTEESLHPASALSPERGVFADRSGKPGQKKGALIRARLTGANPDPDVVGLDRLPFNSNFFHGNDRSAWRTDVPNYSAVVYRDVYPGIDLEYHGDGRSLKYDFVVLPGGDASLIEVSYDGASDISVTSEGKMEVTTGIGPFHEQRPYVYQEIDGVRHEVAAQYQIRGSGVFGFELLSDYDRSHPLIIDPELLYSTYLGGSDSDHGFCIAVDDEGSAYVSGYTYSSDFPMVNPYDDIYNLEIDAFVTKFSPEGNTVLYSTYLGGLAWEEAHAIDVDGSGSAYVTGFTWSADFPTINAFDDNLGGFEDAFVVKLSPAGNSLLYSTFLGGPEAQEESYGISVDESGSAWVTGSTNSSDFPTVNAFDNIYNGIDAFVTKFAPEGNSLEYSTYLGGSFQDYGFDIEVDESGGFYVTGYTRSEDFPMVNPYDDTVDYYDIFVTKFFPSGDALEYSTYVGGLSTDIALAIGVSSSGIAFITGYTYSPDYPLVNAFDENLGGLTEAFVTSLSPAGNSLLYSTYLGGAGGEEGHQIVVDPYGRAYLSGSTSSSDFPTADPYDGTLDGNYDAFVTVIESEGGSMAFSTFLGGSANDFSSGIALDGSANIYIVGGTASSDFPTLNAYDETFNGGSDVFVAKFGSLEVPPCTYAPGDVNNNGTPLELSDVVTMIGNYRGTEDVAFTCSCPPNGAEFAATADPNGNCVPLELGDVVTEIAAYRGNGEASGCPDCPGS